jgi:hypothetical protein
MLEGCADQNMIKCKVFFAICEEAGTDLTAVLDVQDKPKTSIDMWTFFIGEVVVFVNGSNRYLLVILGPLLIG